MISRRIESRKAAVGITLLGIDERPTSNVPNATGADGLPKNLPFRGLGVLGLALLLAGAEAGVEARWLSGAAAGAALRRGVDDMEMGMWSWNAAMGLDGSVVSWSRQTKRSKKSRRAHTGQKHRTSRYHRLKNTMGTHGTHGAQGTDDARRFGSSGVYQYVELGYWAPRARHTERVVHRKAQLK